MRFRLTETKGGRTVFDAEAGECFKSRHSAQAEAEHVFFRPGVAENPWYQQAAPFRVLELGFGLGTNFLYLQDKPVSLISIDRDLSGAKFFLEQEHSPALKEILEKKFFAKDRFNATLVEEDFFRALPRMAVAGERFHCIYFDPFSPKANPDAWSDRLFRLASELLHPAGRLVTYSVSRAAKDGAAAAGLRVEKRELPSELQKRASLLAIKPGKAID